MENLNFLNSLGINVNETNLDKVKQDIFNVTKIKNIAPGDGLQAPEDYHIFDENGRCLSKYRSVGKSFTPQQPRELLEALEIGAHEANVSLDDLEFNQYKDGAKVSLSIKIGQVEFINAAGQTDTTDARLSISTGFDGNTKTTGGLELWRQICTNGMKGWKMHWAVSFKNTKGNAHKSKSLANDIIKGLQSLETFKDRANRYNSVRVNEKARRNFAGYVLQIDPEDLENISTKMQNKYFALQNSIETEIQRTGATLWGLLQGATHYSNHVAPSEKANQEEFILFDTGAKLNERAQIAVQQMAEAI